MRTDVIKLFAISTALAVIIAAITRVSVMAVVLDIFGVLALSLTLLLASSSQVCRAAAALLMTYAAASDSAVRQWKAMWPRYRERLK